MHVKKIKEEWLKPCPTFDETSEEFTVNLVTDSDNSYSDIESTSDGKNGRSGLCGQLRWRQ
jgi:hypothetical protein